VKVSPVLLAKVNIPVPTWKLPEPVALVNVMPVLLTLAAKKFPVPVAFVKVMPVDETVAI